MNFFKKVFNAVKTFFTGPQAEKVAREIQTYTALALPIVKAIAAATPTRVDDEIVALFEKYGVANVDKFLALPADSRGAALLQVATDALAKQLPAGVATSTVQAAVQLAVVAMKQGA